MSTHNSGSRTSTGYARGEAAIVHDTAKLRHDLDLARRQRDALRQQGRHEARLLETRLKHHKQRALAP